MTNSQAHAIATAITSLGSNPLKSAPAQQRKPHTHLSTPRNGPGWDRWLQGFQLANGDDSLSIALERLQLAQAVTNADQRNDELDWWTDVVAFLRVTSRRSHA